VEISQILEMRCQEGLRDYRKKDLAMLSALTTKECNSDVRVAIKTLQYVITKKYDDIQKNFERARDDIYIDLLNDQSDHIILILSAIQKSKERFVKSIYQTYKALGLDFQVKPFTYMHFYNNLSYLQSLGLILLLATNLKSGNPNRVELLFDTAVLDHIRKFRWGR
jgi:Cdc6-like AAA superfamily ATPase